MKELNLLPQSYASHKKILKKKKNIAVVSIIGALLIILCFAFIFGQEIYLNMKKTTLQNEIFSNKELVMKNEKLAQEISIKKQHIEKAKSLEGIKNKDTNKIIEELGKCFPDSLKIEDISFKNSTSLQSEGNVVATIDFSGSAKSKQDVEILWANLRESTNFQDAHISNINEGKGQVFFSAQINAKGVSDIGTENKQ